MKRHCWLLIVLVGLTQPLAAGLSADPQATPGRSALEAIRGAVVDRLGQAAVVKVVVSNLKGEGAIFRAANPDPSARLGGSVRFTLVTLAGAHVPVSAALDVVVPHAVARRPVARGHRLAAEDLDAVVGDPGETPLRRLPEVTDLIGARTLRPIAAGVAVQSTFVARPRVVEPGDAVTVVARVGEAEVRAEFVAADGGQPGDLIRVVNPQTKRYVRARIIGAGLVEVIRAQ